MQIVAAAILFQTLFFRFTAAEESVYIFTRLGMEPWSRIGAGAAERVPCVLLLPRTAPPGALLALLVFSGSLGGLMIRRRHVVNVLRVKLRPRTIAAQSAARGRHS